RARAMAGGSIAHAHLLGVMYQLLGEQFASGPCHAYNSEVKVALADGSYVYPDVSVSCDISDWNADSHELPAQAGSLRAGSTPTCWF
ncbi:MAG: Uma2 family endonuclease, partial [Ktedonobacteraceae bacterium]|nr:Uma2 family endonuclease [Ktedonobacteraceae bacterium]